MAQLRTYKVQRYGWIRDLPDHRDLMYAAPLVNLQTFPPKVDLRDTKLFPDAYDQGKLGSCSGNAIAAAVQFARSKEQKSPDFIPSRLFIYYNERVIEHSVGQDNGAQIRDGVKVVAKLGVCPELVQPAAPYDWPYDIQKFAARPPDACFTFANDNQTTSYRRIPQVLPQMRACLASGFPFVFGFTVYESFESAEVAKTGVVNLPGAAEKPVGGHAVLAVGYDDGAQRFVVRNSWGTQWGQRGYCTMPYAYLTDAQLASDFWTVRQTE
jgi:C1A family cysteine protease